MNCVCCGKAVRGGTAGAAWHKSCIKAFFGTKELPALDIDDKTLKLLAKESINRGFTVPGVQKKLSLRLSDLGAEGSRLTLVNCPTGYILKPQTEEHKNLPEAEHLVMSMAREAGIKTVPFALLELDGKLAYITKRIDRIPDGKEVRTLAMEDFCQLDGRLTQDKYKGSYERCAKIIKEYSCRSGIDLSEFFIRIVFSYIVGNSDMHLKNFSLVETERGKYALSPAYDMLPVNVILPEDNEQLALTLNGKKRNVRRNDFLSLAESCGISRTAAAKMIESVVSRKDRFFALCESSFVPEDMKEKLKSLMLSRIAALQ